MWHNLLAKNLICYNKVLFSSKNSDKIILQVVLKKVESFDLRINTF